MPWSKDVRWWRGKTKSPAAAATIISARGGIRLRGCGVDENALDLTTDNGRLIISNNIVSIRIPVEAGMETLAPDLYDITLTVGLSDGSARRLIAGMQVKGAQ